MTCYFCDVCQHCLETEPLSDRCPDRGKTEYEDQPSDRSAAEKEIQELLQARDEDWD